MTKHNEMFPMEQNEDARSAATEAGISGRLRQFYDSVQEEAIPMRLLELLERLDAAERRAGYAQFNAGASQSLEDSAR